MSKKQTYIGRVSTVRAEEHLGFIAISSVTKDDGSPSRLKTDNDIFVHQDDCDAVLRTGLEVGFQVIPDKKREGSYRATNVAERNLVRGELVLTGAESMPLVDPAKLYVSPTPAQRMAKPVSREEVEQVLKNAPMPRMPRTNGRPQHLTENLVLLADSLFPQIAAIGADTAVAEIASPAFDEAIKKIVADHRSLGMDNQAEKMQEDARAYITLHAMSQNKDGLLLPETVLPMEYLPDLFMAVPVWYFQTQGSIRSEARSRADVKVHHYLRHFCDLMPNERWIDTFLMFNRRLRTLTDYVGDIMPPKVLEQMRKSASLFDFFVVMTPYHDVAGTDWEDLKWLRSIDPYVVGFVKNVPFMFVMSRFSDSGIFPLYSEMVADTIAFLRDNISKLEGFNKIQRLYWYRFNNNEFSFSAQNEKFLGTELIAHTRKLLAAFDRGELFDWMRSPTDEQKQQT